MKRGKAMNKEHIEVLQEAFLNDGRYKELLNEYRKVKQSLQGLKNLSVPDEVYRDKKTEQLNVLRAKIKDYVKIRRGELKEQEETILRYYNERQEVRNSGNNPSDELIRRQNIKAKLSLMTDKEYQEHLNQVETASDYDLSLMKQESEQRGLQGQFKAVYNKVKGAYKNDPRYSRIKELQSVMMLIDKPEIMLYDDQGNYHNEQELR